jgi:signal transduction histidine kinase/predicted hydrocarbon binding protein
MKPEISITDELLSKFCDVHPNAISVDTVEKGNILPREINTTNFKSLLTTSAEVLGGVDKVFSTILKGIDMDHPFITAKDNPYQVEPFSFWHLFQDDYWISNTLSTSVFDNAQTSLRNTVLGKDPLFEAGKRFGLYVQPWKLAAIKMISPNVLLKLVVKINNQLNKIKTVIPFLGKRHGLLRARYHHHITRTKEGALTSKSVCNWYRGCIHCYLSLLQLKEIQIHETACTAEGNDECVFEIEYKPLPLPKKIRNFVFYSMRPDFAVNYENLLWASHISTFNAEQLVKERTAELVEANERLKQEIDARKRAEEELIKYRDHLEELVENRTAELSALNQQLKQEINERKRAEQEAMIRQEQLFQASKMASLGTLVSGVAHEINNPISFVMLNGPTLQKVWQDVRPVLDEYWEANGDFSIANMSYPEMSQRIPLLISGITDGAKRVKTIVSELKEFARQTPPELTDMVDVNRVAETAVGLVSNLVKKSTNRFSAAYEPDMPLVKGNTQRMEQVIINLLLNASQSLTDSEQAVTVSTFHNHASDCVVVDIRDEGKGVPPEVLERIKDPFFTTKRDTGGTGLGLAISERIVRDHGGTMVFESTVGQGTIVKVSFPVRSGLQEDMRLKNGKYT